MTSRLPPTARDQWSRRLPACSNRRRGLGGRCGLASIGRPGGDSGDGVGDGVVTDTQKHYAERDIMWLDEKGEYYFRHVLAMREEGLHSKSDIAAELAWRDYRIAELEAAAEVESAEPVAWLNPETGDGVYGEKMISLRENQGKPGRLLATTFTVPLYRHPPSAVPEGWRPIETAPKDGRHILLGRPETDDQGEACVLGYWLDALEDGSDYMGHDAGFTDADYQIFQPSRSFGAVSHRSTGSQPTHWMPLPAAPQGGEK